MDCFQSKIKQSGWASAWVLTSVVMVCGLVMPNRAGAQIDQSGGLRELLGIIEASNCNPQERTEALDEAITLLRQQVAEDQGSALERLKRKIELSELLLLHQLAFTAESAGEFVEFGIASASQRAAVAEAVDEASALLSSAARLLEEESGGLSLAELGKNSSARPVWVEEFLDGGYPVRFEYLTVLTEYYDGLLRGHGGSKAGAKRIGELLRRLERLIEDGLAKGDARLAVLCLTGRLHVARESNESALTLFEEVAAAHREEQLYDLQARLGYAKALRELGRIGEALGQLERLAGHRLVAGNPLYRLLVADAEHLLLLSISDERIGTEAYRPYETLLIPPALEKEREVIALRVYGRWSEEAKWSSPPADLPVIVAMGIGHVSRLEGQNLIIEGRRVEREGRADAARLLIEQGRDRLWRAVACCERVLERGDAAAWQRVQASFDLGIARYRLAGQDARQTLEAARMLLSLAQETDGEHFAGPAAAEASAMLRPMLAGGDAEVREIYREAAGLLCGRFGDMPTADDERCTLASVLATEGRISEALAVLEALPSSHSQYALAQQLVVECLLRDNGQVRETDAAQLVNRIEQWATGALSAAESSQRRMVEATIVRSRILTAQLLEREGRIEEALEVLAGMEQSIEIEPAWLAVMLERRILLQARIGAYDGVALDGAGLIKLAPSTGRAVLSRVLLEMVKVLRGEASQIVVMDGNEVKSDAAERLRIRATSAADVARILVESAESAGEEWELRLRLIELQRLGGEYETALRAANELAEDHTNDARLVHELAELHYALGSRAHLLEAAGYCDRIIGSMTMLTEPRPEMFWSAWMRRLQISDQLGEHTELIAGRIEQLRVLEEEMGGRPYRTVLEGLEQKYSR